MCGHKNIGMIPNYPMLLIGKSPIAWFSPLTIFAAIIALGFYGLSSQKSDFVNRGVTPAEADLYFLQNAKRMSMYGMDMHKVMKDKLELLVGVAASGLYVYDGRLRIDCFKWQRMLKMSYKAENFLIKVRAGEVSHSDREKFAECVLFFVSDTMPV